MLPPQEIIKCIHQHKDGKGQQGSSKLNANTKMILSK